MEIIYGEYPPNYKQIASKFDLTSTPGVVFTYGDKLYVPGGQQIDQPLLRHEETHSKQQLAMGLDDWWERYLEDPGFRFMQELEAYRNQYRAMAGLPLQSRIGYLDHIAKSLAGPMYGGLVTVDEAKTEITKGIILKHTNANGKNVRKLKKLKRLNRKKGRR